MATIRTVVSWLELEISELPLTGSVGLASGVGAATATGQAVNYRDAAASGVGAATATSHTISQRIVSAAGIGRASCRERVSRCV